MGIDSKVVDKRIVQRALAQGKIDAAEYRAWLEALPDRSDRLLAPGGESQADGAARRN